MKMERMMKMMLMMIKKMMIMMMKKMKILHIYEAHFGVNLMGLSDINS
jgi:hypothetical protein